MVFLYNIADQLSSTYRMLSLFNEHTSHSEFLSKHRLEREKFGLAVGRVLAEFQQRSLRMMPGGAGRPYVHPMARKFLSSRIHQTLERCIGGLAKSLPYCAEALSLALIYIDTLQRIYVDVVNCWTLDRLFATAIVVASKFAYDDVYPNTYYASKLGLTLAELNDLELTFLALFGFGMVPDKPSWVRMHCFIARLAYEPTLEECGVMGSCPTFTLASPLLSKSRSGGMLADVKATSSASASPSPLMPMITMAERTRPPPAPSGLHSDIKVTLMSPESSSSSPKELKEVVATYGKRHSQNGLEDIDPKPIRHRRQRSKSSVGSLG